MYQFGERGPQRISAAAFTTGGGYHFARLPMNPQLWVYYDYATGDDLGGTFTTFNQLFPFGHLYLGFLDLVGRQNIHDLNVHLGLYPVPWVFFWAQYHHFTLDVARDALFNPASVPLRRDPTGRAGSDVGDEIDLLTNFHLGPHSDVLLGYSKLFAGEFIRRTGSPRSPELFYVQYSFRW
jgi:Alginate export